MEYRGYGSAAVFKDTADVFDYRPYSCDLFDDSQQHSF